MHMPSEPGPRKEPDVGISSTRAPSAAAALAAKAPSTSAAAGATSAAKAAAASAGGAVFPPARLPAGPAPAKPAPGAAPAAAPGAGRAAGAPELRDASPVSLDPLAPQADTAPTPTARAPDANADTPAAGNPAAPAARPRPKGPDGRTTPEATNVALTAQAAQAAALFGSSLPGGATTPTTTAPSTNAADAPGQPARPAGVPPPAQGRSQVAAQIASPLGLLAPVPDGGAASAAAPAASGAASAVPATAASSLAGAKAPTVNSAGGAAADSAGAALLTHRDDADTDDANPDASAPADFAAAQAAAAPAATADPAATTAPSVAVHTPMGASGWADEVGAHVIWMAHQGVTSASLRLHPEHLGPVEVKISVHEDSASVWFGASQPETRAALQQSLPQLKDMFATQGMTLTDAGVSGESPRDAQHAQRPAAPATGSAAAGDGATPLSVATRRRGLVDTYA